MKKKKLLFITDSLKIGGTEKSLITILSNFDYKKYDVDLYLLNYCGEFIEFLPKQVNLLPEDKDFKVFMENRILAPFKFIVKFKFNKFYYSLKYLLFSAKNKIMNRELYIGWNSIKHLLKDISKEYDVSISFLERKSIYFNIDKVTSRLKIGFIQTDYSNYPFNYNLDNYYFQFYKKIIAVSESGKKSLEQIFPQYKEKFTIINNIIPVELIKEMAKEDLEIQYNKCNIVTVGRFSQEKGIDRIIPICQKLKEKKLQFKWYIIGDGKDFLLIKDKIKKNKLDEYLILTGSDINPYKWINIADIYVQPSRVEGFGITVAEAKVLRKPIVASKIPAFEEQLENRKNGILCDTEDEFAVAIEELIENEKIRKRLVSNIEIYDNSAEELRKLYHIIEEIN